MPPKSKKARTVNSKMPLQEGATASNSSPQEVHQEVEQGAVDPNINMLYEMIQKTQAELAEIAKHVKKTKTTDEGLQHKPLPEKNQHEKENNEGEKTLYERASNNGFPEGNTNSQFVTLSDVATLIEKEREKLLKETRHFVCRPPYPLELLNKPYPKNYEIPTFSLFDGRKGSALEHVSKFLDAMGPHVGDSNLCLREFSKSLTDRAYTCVKQKAGEGLLDFIKQFQDLALDCYARKTAASVKPIERSRADKRSTLHALVVTSSNDTRNKKKRGKEKEFEEWPAIPGTTEEMHAVIDKWIADGFLRLPGVSKEPTEDDKKHARFCHYHRYVHHPTSECFSLRKIFHSKIQDGTLDITQIPQGVQRNPLPNHNKERGAISVVIHAGTEDAYEELEDSLSTNPAAIKTLQRSPKFWFLFNQLGLGPDARKAITEAIVNIVSRSGSQCYTAEAHASRAFLETTNAVTFIDEDMEVQYPDHRKPLYLTAMINDVHIRRALVDTGPSLNLIPTSALDAAGISRKKIQGIPMEVTGFGGAAEYTVGHIQLVLKVGPIVALTRFHVVNTAVSYHALLGRPWLHKHKLVPSTYHQCVKGRLNGKPIRIPANATPFDELEAHYVEAAFYDEVTPMDEGLISKVVGIPLPRWEDIKDEPDMDLRKLLEQKRKRKEQREDAPKCMQVQEKIFPLEDVLAVPNLSPANEELEMINLSNDPNVELRISISSSLTLSEKTQLISLLKEYRDIFAWHAPKDEFPLPNMDLLIDSAAGHTMFSFMDGFSGYNQIRMSPKDNAGATYQRAMTAIFHDMIHCELEDYVDDVVVKTETREGFLVHQRGIDVDPMKAKAIATMKPPTTVKELKSFLGKLSYIRRFILGLAAVTTAFTLLLNKGVKYEWTDECQQTFQQLYRVMANLPTVKAPIPSVPLALRDAETRYARAERACLSLIYATQKLRHYFMTHTVHLMKKSHPIRTLLQRPVLSGRLAQWLLKLSEYEIIPITPKAIKSQAIVDLLAQFPGEDASSINDKVPGKVDEVAFAEISDAIWTLRFEWLFYHLWRRSWSCFNQRSFGSRVKDKKVKGARRFKSGSGELYRRLPGGVLARCISLEEAKKKLAEVHERTCCLKNPVPLYRRLQCIGYYWPSMKAIIGKKAQARRYKAAARVANMFSKKRKLMLPFPLPIGGPHSLRNGQAEAINRVLLRILSKMVFEYNGGWTMHLLDTLWSYRNSVKTATGFSPFCLVYGTEAMSLAELIVPTARIIQGQELELDADMCAEVRMVDLEVVEEIREVA
uniref:RNA-directed DNA polymerase n=1 Tax=Fagus sylvatica TaxID=28930 RepID=A0A2N9ED87_FAGSY